MQINDVRKKKIFLRKMLNVVLGTLLGVAIFLFVALCHSAGLINKSARAFNASVVCDFCDELVKELRAEEAEKAAKERAEKIANARGIIYLTFDDGPGEYTNTLLDVLDRYDTKATFFVTGRGDDNVLTREYQDGHAVGLHTFSHSYATIYRSVEAFLADLNLVAERVKNLTGMDSKLLRFPGGSSNLVSKRYDGGVRIMSRLTQEVSRLGYQYFDWNVDSDDAGKAKTADEVYQNVVTHLKDGPNVVLQHDVKAYSVEAVERIIEYGNNNNFVFEPLSTEAFPAHHGVNN